MTTEETYWENRYAAGGNSGAGSRNRLLRYKANFINHIIDQYQVKSIIDWGCGDGHLMELLTPKYYLGTDISTTAIEKLIQSHTRWPYRSFMRYSAYKNNRAQMAISIDVIFHLVSPESLHDYMQKLFQSAREYVLIYSSNGTVPPSIRLHSHLADNRFTDWIEQHQPHARIILHQPNQYPYDPARPADTSISDWYLYQIKN
jgi:SAM-dependent methyltransferase